MTIVENSYYDHQEYGRVKVITKDPTVVGFQIVGEKTTIPGLDNPILQGKYQAVSDFKAQTEPADLEISVTPAAVFGDASEVR